jgi:hypothetical protein
VQFERPPAPVAGDGQTEPVVLRSNRAGKVRLQVAQSGAASRRFRLYVEGPRDHDILRIFAAKQSPILAREMDRSVEILGGRQPARAVELFRRLGVEKQPADGRAPARGLCVLDRDDSHESSDKKLSEPGLDFFVWSRRHIESYLLVPSAIRRGLGLSGDDPRVTRLLGNHLPDPEDEVACQRVDAKRLLAPTGPIARALGRRPRPRDVARHISPSDLHPDVKHLLARIREGLGITPHP